MRRHLLLFAAPLALLSACASAGGKSHPTAAAAPPATTAYGMFLAGQGALNDGHSAQAAQFFTQARQVDAASDTLITEKAFTAALLAGEVPRAAALAPAGEGASEAARRMGALVVGVEGLAEGKGQLAYGALTSSAIGFPHRAAAALLAPWAAAQAGDVEASVVRPQVRGDRVVDYFGALGQALLYERAKRFDEADAAFKEAAGGESPGQIAVISYGGYLERRGRRHEAASLYAAALTRDPSDGIILAAKRRAEKGKAAPPAPTVLQGAAQAMLAPTATMIAAKQNQIALAYLRLMLRLDPQRDEAWLMVGDIMQANGDTDSARAAYAHPKPGSPEYAAAQAKLAWTFEQADDHETALKIARQASAGGDFEARMTLADLLRANERFEEAQAVLTSLIKESPQPDWRLYFGRAVAYERLGRWPEAESDLQAALKVRPDEPELLNYLGYSWIDRGEHLTEAMGMVEKAVAGEPRSGAMVDSLGWAYYRLGDFPHAVEKLEEAVELDAGDPEINDHLGDAYWRVGRRDEANFQWRRVLTLKPDDKVRASVTGKLASGLGPDGPAPKLAGQ